MSNHTALGLILSLALLLGGCGRPDAESTATQATPAPTTEAPPNYEPITLQLDWFPQAEQGGFFQAVARGFYREAGFEVSLRPGGPNAQTTHQVLRGAAQFAMNRADTVRTNIDKGMPLFFVMATLQHDPQAVVVHADDPVQTLADLDGRRVMAVPGLTWIAFIERRYGLRMEILPHDFGMERFLADPRFIQQCLETNEPYYLRRQGAAVRVLPLRASGFNPYHGIYCLLSYHREDPERTARFVAASIRGWRDYMEGDPGPAFTAIAALNPKMTPDFLRYSWETLKAQRLVEGSVEAGETIGQVQPSRMREIQKQLYELGLVQSLLEDDPWFLPSR